MTREDVSEILVRGPNWLGDLVMSTPGLRALRAGFPQAKITLHVRPGLEQLLAGSPWLDRVETVHSYHRGPASMLAEGRRLRKAKRFDLGVCLPDSISSALLMKLAGVRRVVGHPSPGRGPLLDQAVGPSVNSGRTRWVAREQHVLELMRALGCPDLGTDLSLSVLEVDREELARVLAARGGAHETAPGVALAPGASYGASKRWPVTHFAEVGDSLAAAGARVFLLGSSEEVGLTRAVCEAMQEPAVDLAGALDLGALKAFVEGLALLVANDAGSRHLAAAFGVPSLIFFGSTSVDKTPLNLEAVRVFQRTLACRPCYLRRCPRPGHPCLSGIEPKPVADVAVSLLKSQDALPQVGLS
ncbi:MAG: lipopolysaccharide heptosyltransferase II [Myxococcota bacterium]